jgi:hypothetical protein
LRSVRVLHLHEPKKYYSSAVNLPIIILEPILQLLNLRIHGHHCGTQVREFIKWKVNVFSLKTHHATGGVVNFYSAGVVTHDRRIGSWLVNVTWSQSNDHELQRQRKGKLTIQQLVTRCVFSNNISHLLWKPPSITTTPLLGIIINAAVVV